MGHLRSPVIDAIRRVVAAAFAAVGLVSAGARLSRFLHSSLTLSLTFLLLLRGPRIFFISSLFLMWDRARRYARDRKSKRPSQKKYMYSYICSHSAAPTTTTTTTTTTRRFFSFSSSCFFDRVFLTYSPARVRAPVRLYVVRAAVCRRTCLREREPGEEREKALLSHAPTIPSSCRSYPR